MSVLSNGDVSISGAVGIGTATPQAKLEVAGRIRDLTGFVIPVGTLLPYAGAVVPEGWLLCDGTSLLRATYPELFAAVGTSWGATDATHFNLPDMRGRSAFGADNMAGQRLCA